MKLSREETITFIRLVKKNPVLWQTTRGDYCDKEKKRLAWSRIANYFKHAEGGDAYRKFRDLLTTYTAALTKMRVENKTSSKLFYFNEMHFMEDQVKSMANPFNRTKVAFDRVKPKPTEGDEANLDSLMFSEADESDEESDTENPFANNDSLPLKDMEVKALNIDYLLDNMPGCSPAGVSPVPSLLKPGEGDNEFTTFGLHVAMQLKQLDALPALELMYEIQALITQKRIWLLNGVGGAPGKPRAKKAKSSVAKAQPPEAPKKVAATGGERRAESEKA